MGLLEYVIALEYQFLGDNTEKDTSNKRRWIASNRRYFCVEDEIIARNI